MSRVSHRRTEPVADDETNLTQALEKLSLPIAPVSEDPDEAPARPTALLICRNGHSKKWGPRWLSQAGLAVGLHDDSDAALEYAETTPIDVVIVELGILRDHDIAAFAHSLHTATGKDVPIIAMCAGKGVAAALDANVHDVARKPYEWRLIAQRARRAARTIGLESDRSRAEEALASALEVADEARRRLRAHESTEPVTGLPTRKKFLDLLGRTIEACDRENSRIAICAIGFNRFRLIVEAMGQERAEMVLAEIGKTLGDCLAHVSSAQEHSRGLRTAVAATIGRESFAIMFTCSASDNELAAVQRQLIYRLSRPVQIAGQTVYLSACIGAAIYPQDGDESDQLLQRAENAMYDARSHGGGFRFYCTKTDTAAARKLKLEHMLHEALDDGDLELAYQPIFDMTAGHVTGAEALLRWNRNGQPIEPEEFAPVAEESGLMIRVGDFVLDRACQQFAQWRSINQAPGRICVNISKVQLTSGALVDTVERLLQKYEFDPAALELELSERGVLSGNFDVINELHALKKLGVRLSVDDFGTGDSAIAYLRELPVDVIKIDQSYVHDIGHNTSDAAIVSAMIALGRGLSLKVIAEGVETPEQYDALKALGCEEFQGFIVSKALSGDEVLRFLKACDHKFEQLR